MHNGTCNAVAGFHNCDREGMEDISLAKKCRVSESDGFQLGGSQYPPHVHPYDDMASKAPSSAHLAPWAVNSPMLTLLLGLLTTLCKVRDHEQWSLFLFLS
jgi:hypothetical protein